MKIFTAQQIRDWDSYTMQHEPIDSLALMERAATKFADVLMKTIGTELPVYFVCGMGNNGGDGLVAARYLAEKGYQVKVILVKYTTQVSPDFAQNLERLPAHLVPEEISAGFEMPHILDKAVIVDALFGSGLNRPLEGLAAEVVFLLNDLPCKKIAIDIPSGLFADTHTESKAIFKADHTITFQVPKLAFLLPENEQYVGEWEILDIGLHPEYYKNTYTDYYLLDPSLIQSLYLPRAKFSHKGTFGHSLLLVGSYGKMGAALLAAKATLRAGAGLVTAHVPACGCGIMQTTLPEAMVSVDINEYHLTQVPDFQTDTYAAIGLGCGLGQAPATRYMLRQLLKKAHQPLVIDADALNLLAQMPNEVKDTLPSYSILTPHPKEFSRWVGKSDDDFQRLQTLQHFAMAFQVYVILKGANTVIATPEGRLCFNTTGNAGMATAGSGDVLTGVITGLLSQGYTPEAAAILGVHLHGKCGDLALQVQSQESLIASDLIDYLGIAYKGCFDESAGT